jgi:hypothetical protein
MMEGERKEGHREAMLFQGKLSLMKLSQREERGHDERQGGKEARI